MLQCPYCDKKYKREKALNKHKLICSLNSDNFDYDEIIPTKKEMWKMIQRLVKKSDQQEKKIEKLENIINRDVKKINVVEWLTENQSCNIDFKEWVKSNIIVTIEDIKTIFITDFMRGLNNIITNNIIDKEIPLKAFTHKIRQLYLYENKKWRKASKKDIKHLFDRIQINILKISKEYDKTLTDIEKFGPNNIQYLKNQQKIMIVDTKKKEKCFSYIESTCINLIKMNLNELTKFKFYI
tara:strand:- start:578 stop:1294 length:717 start_codon:yes stop_codon:yes gene_type:complete